ncbi:MAG: FAD-dependent oxidoreductase [Thermoanaerobaculia bacterium]|nr:FAD-dependent oxidoreductase [Thermoanaerobaculia bacterium]
MTPRVDVVIVGSGFAGAILARCLARRGLRVALVERDRHPRFALGESSTPLAALSLERLAHRFDLPDLAALAAHGRLRRNLPALGCGLKRGFTFYGHTPGRPRDPAERLLVAASPNDEVADVHWLRADVDAHLARAAEAAGVLLREGVEVQSVAETGSGVRVRGAGPGGELDLAADFLVDATGTATFAQRVLGIEPSRRGGRVTTSLIYGHFEGVEPLAGPSPTAPYPEEKAAIHHLLAEGWLYGLPFDSGLVSAGLELIEPLPGPPEGAFRRLLGQYPSLAQAFSRARPVRPVAAVPRLQFRQSRAVGARFLLLPSAFAFTSPLFSTGLAWSLRGVERTLALLADGPPGERALAGYHERLVREAEWIERLVKGALAARGRFELFAAWSLLYFTAASFAEARERLLPEPASGWADEGFLSAESPHLAIALSAAEAALTAALAGQLSGEEFAVRIREWIHPLDVAGFSAPRPDRLYPLDLEALVAAAPKLGLTAAAVRRALPRLLGVK